MPIALIDNGSLEPAAQLNLRRAARAIGALAQQPVAAVSWKHSDLVPAAQLDGEPAWTVGPWVRDQWRQGAREFVFIPFFISAQGAIGSALAAELAGLRAQVGAFEFTFAAGLAQAGVLPAIVAERIREAGGALERPAVIVVDHGGPARSSAQIRDQVAAEVARLLEPRFRRPVAASMESPDGPDYAFNRPLLAEALAALPAEVQEVVVAPLFLSPGRHAGPAGDLARIAADAQRRRPGLRVHFTELIGTHPMTFAALAGTLRNALNPTLYA